MIDKSQKMIYNLNKGDLYDRKYQVFKLFTKKIGDYFR